MGFAVSVEGAGGGVPRWTAEGVGRGRRRGRCCHQGGGLELNLSEGGSVVNNGGNVPFPLCRRRVVIVMVDGMGGQRSNCVAAADGGDNKDHCP
mmetsp:Transcript_27564/g.57275  ORF Transcript_27564/g.57275 Transcript_27564/m.57275 type:complete len:94 (-) Transcript_27564:192-473(-)